MKPLKIRGRTVHHIGLPYHWSSNGLVRGDAANELIGFVGDPNVSIQESKAFTGMLVAGRRRRGRSPLATRLTDLKEWERDLPVARGKPESQHGFKAEETKEGSI